MQALKSQLCVRWQVRRDLAEILAIEATLPRPVGEAEILAWSTRRDTIALVVEQNEQVIGHAAYELHADHLRLLHLAVHPECRRNGAGMALADKLLSKLGSHRRDRVVVDVPEHDLGTLLFFKAAGWIASRVLRGADEATGADMIEFIGRPLAGEL